MSFGMPVLASTYRLSIEHQRKARVRREHIKFALPLMPGVCIGCFIN